MESFIAGAAAGLTVDLLTFPLDTIKTRLQAQVGNTTRLYRGVGAMLTGSVPTAAVFFWCFDTAKPVVGVVPAALLGELLTSVFRVPVEVVKQRMQAGGTFGAIELMKNIYQHSGVAGLYAGFKGTLWRDLPFACIQYPLYHQLTNMTASFDSRWLDGVCGGVAGGVAAFATHPMDLVKTRTVVLGTPDRNPFWVIQDLRRHGKLWCGVRQRVGMFTIGGFLYFGAYSVARQLLSSLDD